MPVGVVVAFDEGKEGASEDISLSGSFAFI